MEFATGEEHTRLQQQLESTRRRDSYEVANQNQIASLVSEYEKSRLRNQSVNDVEETDDEHKHKHDFEKRSHQAAGNSENVSENLRTYKSLFASGLGDSSGFRSCIISPENENDAVGVGALKINQGALKLNRVQNHFNALGMNKQTGVQEENTMPKRQTRLQRRKQMRIEK